MLAISPFQNLTILLDTSIVFNIQKTVISDKFPINIENKKRKKSCFIQSIVFAKRNYIMYLFLHCRRTLISIYGKISSSYERVNEGRFII